MVRQPLLQTPEMFVASIREYPLWNKRLPVFDPYAQQLLELLGKGETPKLATIGDALRMWKRHSDGKAEVSVLPFPLKLVIVGYSYSDLWTFNAKLGFGTPVRLMLRGLLEAERFEIHSDFTRARYGALEFQFLKINRMDLADKKGSKGTDGSPFFERQAMDDVQVQRNLPGHDARIHSLDSMLQSGVLTPSSGILTPKGIASIANRWEHKYEPASYNIISSGVITVESKKRRGRRTRDDDVLKVFLIWYKEREDGEMPGIDASAREIRKLSEEMKQSLRIKMAISFGTIKSALKRMGFYDQDTRTWSPGTWEQFL